MKRGDKVSIKDYKCNRDGTCTEVLRPAEITVNPSDNDELVFVKFLDEKFIKGKRSLHSIQVLRNKIVKV